VLIVDEGNARAVLDLAGASRTTKPVSLARRRGAERR
jgi:hypothetical protein